MRIALVVLLTTLVATCGQKGPLELPPPTDGAGYGGGVYTCSAQSVLAQAPRPPL